MATKTKMTTRKPVQKTPQTKKADDPEQYERFRQAAREHGTDESEAAFDRAFRKIVPRKSSA
jgi:hypothetical protein